MSSLSQQLTRPDYLTGDLVISRWMKVQLAAHELVGGHTFVACHIAHGGGPAEAIYVCLRCGSRQPCTDAAAASIYELVEGPGPIRLHAPYWQPPVAENVGEFREIARLLGLSRRWLALGAGGMSLMAFSLALINIPLFIAGGLLALICMNRYEKASMAWLDLIGKQIESLDRLIAAYQAQAAKWLAATQAEDEASKSGSAPPDA
jgi:hypothetical protein